MIIQASGLCFGFDGGGDGGGRVVWVVGRKLNSQRRRWELRKPQCSRGVGLGA